MKIRSISTLEELAAIRDYWEEWQEHPNVDFDHFQIVCRQRQEIIHPYVMIMERDGGPRALLLARLENTHFEPCVGYLKICRIPTKTITVLYQGLIGNLQEEDGAFLIKHLESQLASAKADAVVFHNLPKNSLIFEALRFQKKKFGHMKADRWTMHWSMTLPQRPGEILKKMRSKHRSWVRRKEREIEAAFPGKVDFQWLKEFDNINGLCDQLESIAKRTYQRALGAGFVNDDEYRQRFTLFAHRGQLRVYLLNIEEKPCAFWIGVLYCGVFHSWDTGYDPKLRPFEPGTLIFLRMIDELVREGVEKLDFGFGDAHYKQRFGDDCWSEATVRMFAPSLKGVILESSLELCNTVERAGRFLLEKSGLTDRIKTAWRRSISEAQE